MDPRTPSELDTTGTLPIQGAAAADPAPSTSGDAPAWLAEARDSLTQPGKYLVHQDGDRHKTIAIEREWTRIGRSLAADVRFDDATVSRRHALIVQQSDGIRVLDDRSLNGVYVNGRRVEWSPLKDGDQIVVGRHTLVFLDTATVGSATSSTAGVAE